MEGETGRKRKISELHNQLKVDLSCDYLDERINEGRSAKKFRLGARKFLETETDRAEKEPIEILDRLEARGHIGPGSYNNLIELVEPIDIRIVSYIREKQEEIRNISIEDGKKNEKPDLTDVATRILRSTKMEIMEHESDMAYIPLSYVSQGKAILDKYGMLVIVGRSGSGKSKCALEILSSRKKLDVDLIFKLHSLDDWNSVVDPIRNTYIWFDDLFEKRIDQSVQFEKSKLETMISTAKYGKVKIIFTMNDKAQEIFKADLSIVFKEDIFMYIDSGTLTRENKLDILKSHLSNKAISICPDDEYFKERYESAHDARIKYIRESEVDAILRTDSYLGYPLCCYLFSSDKDNFCQGHTFFESPSNKLMHSIDGLRLSADKTNVHQYCVLVYAAFQDGKVNLEEIDSELLSSIVDSVDDVIIKKSELFIRKGISLLERSYLFKTKESEVYHSSIIKATLVSYSKISLHAKIKVLATIDPLTFCEIVRSDEGGNEDKRYQISVSSSLFPDVANIIRDRIQNEELSILNTKLFEKEQFVTEFLKTLPETLCVNTFTHACKYSKLLIVQRMQQLEEFKTSVSQDTLTKGFQMACLSGNREIVEFLIGQTFLHPKTMMEILHPVRHNSELAILLLQKLQLSSDQSENLHSLSKILVRDECHDVLRYFHQHFVCPEDIIQFQANLAGRRRSLPLVKWFIETFPSKKNDLVVEMIKGACIGGSRSVMKYLYENFGDEISNASKDFLKLACESGNPVMVEELLKSDKEISKLEIGENLNMACFKGFCQVVRVILTNTTCLNADTDIVDGISNALKGNQIGVLGVLQDFYDIPENIIIELREEIHQNANVGPLSSMPFTPAPYRNIPSVNISTPCIFQQKHRNQTPRRVLKKIQVQMEPYKRCQDIWNLSDEEYNAPQIKELLHQKPKLSVSLLTETIKKVVTEGHGKIINVLMDSYPDLRGSMLKEFLSVGETNENIMQCIHSRFECDMTQYMAFASKESIPFGKIINCLSRNRCVFSPFSIIKALEDLTKQGENIELLLNSLDSPTVSYTCHQLFLDACKDEKVDIVKILLNGNYVPDLLVEDAFDQCCVYEAVDTMKVLNEQRPDLFKKEVLSNAAERCCKGGYLSSLYFLLNTLNADLDEDNYKNLCLSLLLQTKNEDVILFLLSYCEHCFDCYCRRGRKFYKELLLKASSENTLILRCFNAVDECYFHSVDLTSKVKALKTLRKNKNIKGIKLWYLLPTYIGEKHRTIFVSVLFSDELIEQGIPQLDRFSYWAIFNNAIAYLFKNNEKGKLSKLLSRDISIIEKIDLDTMSEERKNFLFDCLPPVSQVEQSIIQWADRKSDNKSVLSVDRFLSIAKYYEFKTETMNRVHVILCRTEDKGAIHRFWEIYSPTLNEECFNSACINEQLDVLSLLINRDDFPHHLIKLSEYSLYYILRDTVKKLDSPIRNALVSLIYKNIHGNKDFFEPLCDSFDLQAIWRRLNELFNEDITNEIVAKVAKLCCEHINRYNSNVKLLLFLNEMCNLSKSDIYDCCEMMVNNKEGLISPLKTCAILLKNSPLSLCLKFARFAISSIKIIPNNYHRYFTEKYLEGYGDDDDFGKVCKRWLALDYHHPYYRKRAMALFDEFANK